MNLIETISNLFDFAFNNPLNQLLRIDLGEVNGNLSNFIAEKTGIITCGAVFSMDNYAILHTITEHSNEKMEAQRGQVAVNKNSFSKLLEIIASPDVVKYAGKNIFGNDVVVFDKQLDNLYFAVWEIRIVQKKRKRNRLMLKTLYIRKTKKVS